MSTLAPISFADVAKLAEEAESYLREQESVKQWRDLYPVVEPFVARGGRYAIKDAVSYLIERKIIASSQRGAAEKAFQRERRQRTNQTK